MGQTENYGRGKTVAYLTQLEGVEKPDIDRICKFAEPVVKASPEAGLEIFTAETPGRTTLQMKVHCISHLFMLLNF